MDGETFEGMPMEIGGKKVTVYPSAAANGPVVYLNTFEEEGERVAQALREGPNFTLVTIAGLDWNRDMSPWAAPPAMKGDEPFSGGADAYLALLRDEIAPRAEACAPGGISWRGIAGYSLAGLFALYALYRTDFFSRAASMSGSLWFPGFRDYALAHAMQRRPDCLYLSLGDREHRTRNSVLRTVQEETEAFCAHCRAQGIPSTFEMNPGNHFQDPVGRTAAGIGWMLAR